MTVALELIAQDPNGLEVAATVGAERIELCCGLELGGLTASAALIAAAVATRDAGGPAVHVLVRPRPGGFDFSDEESELIVADSIAAVGQGVDGVVIGGSREGVLDLELIARVVDAVGEASVTVHRVVDSLGDPVAAVTALLDSGVRRVLTSGGADRAPDGVATIARMVAAADGRLEIMAGGGVSVASVPALIDAGVDAIHASASRRTAPGPSGYLSTDLGLARDFRSAVDAAG